MVWCWVGWVPADSKLLLLKAGRRRRRRSVKPELYVHTGSLDKAPQLLCPSTIYVHTAWLQIHTCDLLTRLTHLHQRRLTCVTILQSSGSGPVMFPLCSYNTLAERTGIWHQLLYLPAVDRQRDTAGWLELFTLTHLHPVWCLLLIVSSSAWFCWQFRIKKETVDTIIRVCLNFVIKLSQFKKAQHTPQICLF